MTGTNKGPTKALTLITGGGDIARDSARSEEAGVDRGEDSGGEHGRRTRRVAGVHRAARREAASRRRARWVPRVAARALVGATQRRACWVPRSGARTGCRAAALGGGQATAGASTKVPCVFLRNWSLLRRKTNAQEGTGKLCHQHLAAGPLFRLRQWSKSDGEKAEYAQAR